MHVGLVTNFPKSTGSGRYAHELFSALKGISAGDFELLSCGESAADPIRGITFPVYRQTLNSFLVYPRRIPKGYDITHLTNQFLMNGARFCKNPVVTVLDTIMLDYPSYPFLTRVLQKNALKSLNFARHVISISEYTKETLVRLGIDADKIKATHLGYDRNVFKRQDKSKCRDALGLPHDKKIVLHVGSEEPRKNVDKILLALGEVLKSEDAVLVRVGQNSKSISALAERLGIADKLIRFKGGVSDSQLSLIYNAADMFVFPSSYEGFGFPPLEAMACGVPVVSSDKTSLKEVVGNAALIVEPDAVSQIAGNILEVLGKKSLQSKLSLKGLRQAKKFSWEKCAKETLGIYEMVLSKA